MDSLINVMDQYMYYFVEICTTLMELIGIFVLVYTAVVCFVRWLRHGSSVRLALAQGIALALEFKMGGEVLRTVVVRQWQELGILGAVIILRGVLTFLIHWEIKNEKKEQMEKAARQSSAPAEREADRRPEGGEHGLFYR